MAEPTVRHDAQPGRHAAPFHSVVGPTHECNRRVMHDGPDCRCRCGHAWPTRTPGAVPAGPCASCEAGDIPEGECMESPLACGHHSWPTAPAGSAFLFSGVCDWCGTPPCSHIEAADPVWATTQANAVLLNPRAAAAGGEDEKP